MRDLASQDSMGQRPRKGPTPMSSVPSYHQPLGHWWTQLDLTTTLDDSDKITERILRDCHPVKFAHRNSNPEAELSFKQVLDLIETNRQEAELQRQPITTERHAIATAEFDSAFSLADGDVLVESGRWVGFTHNEAAAWCWNLFQYEPTGFVHPNSEVRTKALRELRLGGLPAVFGYPERARRYADAGLTAREYRNHREAINSPIFHPSDVRFTRR